MSLPKALPSSLPLRGGSGMQLTVPCPLERWKGSVALRKGEDEDGRTDRQTEKQFPHLFWPLPSLECWPVGSQEGQERTFIEPSMCLCASHHHDAPIPISQRSQVRHREVKPFAEDHTATKWMSQGPHPLCFSWFQARCALHPLCPLGAELGVGKEGEGTQHPIYSAPRLVGSIRD